MNSSMAPLLINNQLNDYIAKVLSMYLKFPDDQPITAVDFRCGNGRFLYKLTEKHKGEKYLFGVDEEAYHLQEAKSDYNFYKVNQSSYKAEGKMSKEAFSLVVVHPFIKSALVEELFHIVDPFIEPDFEEEERQRLLAQQSMLDQFDFGEEELSEEDKKKKEEEFQKKLEKAVKDRRLAYRRALREQERRLLSLRDDHFLLARATERLMPNGILVMITPKELIDQAVTIRLANQYEDIKILRLDDEDYEQYRKCIILARKKGKKSDQQDKSKGILLAETKLTPYKQLEVLEPQVEPSYIVPPQHVDAVEFFRLGPMTASEALDIVKRSPLIENYQKTYSQVLTQDDPVSPTPLHKGHIMLLLTSGLLNGYIGKGPDQHLVKGSAVKMTKTTTETDDEGVQTVKEREYYHISVKYLDRNGKFHKLM
jgi:SAM-dependent methyltransferase